ncbi:hypothetical protein XELAEV_18000722mg [Xenopus laevis]|uniref:Uncharacterized protein n=1 Tax=Xenopus laevis TaxID=8355 RepID=A0A974BP83_XENLA|nr:hypothetical protein XELAEV_18000722mg [Xenopus laevis]
MGHTHHSNPLFRRPNKLRILNIAGHRHAFPLSTHFVLSYTDLNTWSTANHTQMNKAWNTHSYMEPAKREDNVP